MSIPGWDNKSFTIVMFPFSHAIINGVLENTSDKFYKWFDLKYNQKRELKFHDRIYIWNIIKK